MPIDTPARVEANTIVADRPTAQRTSQLADTLVAGPRIDKPDELTWWDWTVFLLHTAAEVEHALMVQYLYAAYSLADGGYTGTDIPLNASDLVREWRRTLLSIARQEMAHLLTLQNVLRLLGGQLNLERQDFPFRSTLYPFPLQLERLTKTSLAKYVAAEMPAYPSQPPELIDEIVHRATGAVGGMPINRVGLLYDTLVGIIKDEQLLADSDFHPETADPADPLQAPKSDWRLIDGMIIRTVQSRYEAVAVLEAIGEQGEGSANLPPDGAQSHTSTDF